MGPRRRANDGVEQLVRVWIEDRVSGRDSDYTLVGFDIDHQWRTVEVPLASLRTRERDRPLSLGEVWGLAIFLNRRGAGALRLQVDNLRLEDG